eukprot:TRINITY_DN10691_c0_g1_i5.p1 TRINITY_DN10691_c0_g1~~TRINITY_DN10691_c0_g1_i5.p1  ORF type:complete len:164 (+),score=48.31 TRINITY_DN10691_c0_g1_i5:48-494(+)
MCIRDRSSLEHLTNKQLICNDKSAVNPIKEKNREETVEIPFMKTIEKWNRERQGTEEEKKPSTEELYGFSQEGMDKIYLQSEVSDSVPMADYSSMDCIVAESFGDLFGLEDPNILHYEYLGNEWEVEEEEEMSARGLDGKEFEIFKLS